MNLEFIKALQADITRFLMVIVFATIFAGGSYYYYVSIQEERNIAERNLNEIKSKYENAVESKKRLEEFKKRYEKLKALEITETENRLNWIDLIDSTARDNGIPYVKYNISPQEISADKGLASKYPGIDVYLSKMQLEIVMLHEGDLYTLINELDKNARGLFDINTCEISRRKSEKPSVIDSGTNRNFIANCTLNWYTMKPKGI